MKKYIARVDIGGELESVEFETDGSPVEWLWGRYGMATYIENLKEIIDDSVIDIKIKMEVEKE